MAVLVIFTAANYGPTVPKPRYDHDMAFTLFLTSRPKPEFILPETIPLVRDLDIKAYFNQHLWRISRK